MHIRYKDDDRSIAGSAVPLFIFYSAVLSGDVSIHVSDNASNNIVDYNVFRLEVVPRPLRLIVFSSSCLSVS